MTRKRKSENELMATASPAAAPVRRKPAARPRAKRTATPETVIATTPSEIAEPQTAAPAVVTTFDPSHEQIAALAYLYWEARGGQGGSSEEDWLRAEQELRSRAALAIAVTA